MTNWTPRAGSKTERAIEALRAGPVSARELSDLMDCDTKQVPSILATAVSKGLVHVDKRSTPFVFSLTAPPPSGSESSAAVAAPAEATPPAPPPASPAPAAPPPAKTRRPRVAKLDSIKASLARASRFGLFNDGTLVIESGESRIELDAAATAALIAFFDSHAQFSL